MESTFFYTFSTIAQTLAGAIALLSAFVLYRLQALNAEIRDTGEYLASWADTVQGKVNEAPAKSLFSRGHYNQLLGSAEQAVIPEGHYAALIERERLRTLLILKPKCLRRFRTSLYLTAGLVTASILALTNTPCLASSCCASSVLGGAMLWFVLCVASYVWLLHAVLADDQACGGRT